MNKPQLSTGWWSRECGGWQVLALALPLVISTGSYSLTLFVDRTFLLWHSKNEMAAAMPSGILHWTIICLPIGIAAYANTFVAQYHGANQPKRIGLVVWQALRIGLYCTPLALLMIPLAEPIFRFWGHAENLVHLETVYFQLLTLAAGPAIMCAAASTFFTGRGETRVIMYANIAQTTVNISLDYILIFGALGAPEMGIAGAAVATVVSTWFKLLIYLLIMHRRHHRETYGIREGRRFDYRLSQRLFLFGGPNGLQYLFENFAFAFIVLQMGRFGDTVLAATTLAFNVNAVAFIPMIGIGIAVSTLVGRELMRGRADLASRATWTALSLGGAYTLVFGTTYLVWPDLFLMPAAAGVETEEFAEIRGLTVVFLRFVAAYCLFDAMQIIFVGAIKGAGDTWFVLLNTIVVSTLAIVVGWVGESYLQAKMIWWWSVVTGWVFAMGVIYCFRFIQGKWRVMSVIEREFAAGAAADPESEQALAASEDSVPVHLSLPTPKTDNPLKS